MRLAEFAATYRLRISRDECGDLVIAGRFGEIGEYDRDHLYACFHGEQSRTRAHRINAALRRNIGRAVVKGTDEALFVFVGEDDRFSRWFIRTLGIRQKRILSETERHRLKLLSERYSPIRTRALGPSQSADAKYKEPEVIAEVSGA